MYFRLVEGISANVGFRMQIISPEEIKRINPFIDTTGVVAGAWTLDDGYVDPYSCCRAMAVGAQNMGANIILHNRVTDIKLLPNGEWEVFTERGNIIWAVGNNSAGCVLTMCAGVWWGEGNVSKLF